MSDWTILFVVVLMLKTGNGEGQCSNCSGDHAVCRNGVCDCSDGYLPIPDYQRTNCVKCPGLGEKCYDSCCSSDDETLQCWYGVCQQCHDYGNWICTDPTDELLLVSGSQIVMAVALVLGIIATFTLIYKLCGLPQLRPLGNTEESRLSIGSLQIYVNERLRDAPPKYTMAAPSGSSIYPASVYVNAGFLHDNSLPPPPYTPAAKTENEPNPTVHI